jgi:pyruvate dehydrogenase E1 component beta subunit
MSESTRQLSYAKALNEGLDVCMARDERVFLIGLGATDPTGIFGTTTGLEERYGGNRVFDMPISENAVSGVALGASLVGMRPVMTHIRLEFGMLAIDQLANQAAKWHYMFGGQSPVPLTIRMIVGRGWGQGAQHSQSLHAWFAHIPGLTVVMPATAYDAKGLLISSIEYDGPVLVLEHRWLYNIQGPVPSGHYTVPLRVPRIVRSGTDVTIVASSYMTLEAVRASNMLASQGIEAEIIDLRTISPLDDSMILESVGRTGHLVVCDHATYTGSFAGEVVSRVCEKAFSDLKSPPQRVTMPDAPTPTSRGLANYFYPLPDHIVAATRRARNLPVEDPFKMIRPEDFLDVPDKSFTGPF